MKGKLKRSLSIALACVMLLVLLPAGALAAEETAATEITTEEETIIPAEGVEVTEPEAPAEETAIPEENVEATEPEAPAEEAAIPEESVEATEPEAPAETAEEASETDTAAPMITELSVAGSSASADQNGSLIASVTADTALAGKAFSLVTSEAVSFVEDDNPATGSLYVAAASTNAVTLAFALGDNEDDYSISMTSTNGVNWSGSFSSSFAMTMGELGEALNTADATLATGAMVSTATQTGSTAYRLYCNQDEVNTQLVVCPVNTATYTVTYIAADVTYNWTVPTGGALTEPTLSLLSTQTLEGWYYDTDHAQAVTFGVAVTGNLTLYANIITTTSGTFADGLDAHDLVLYIKTAEDWASFLSRSGEVLSTQRVELELDINLGGASYTPLTFAGNFNGNNHTISNGTFTAVNGNAGLFNEIGANQIICNLKLDSITVKYASTYAGVLAASISGTEGHNARIQNVQVTNSSVSGRSAGGIAGFIFWADVQYCSSRDTTISGIANGGGIGGISYGFIIDCYSTCTPTALTSSGRGGIVGKNLEGGTVTYCWCTYSQEVGTTTDATTQNNLPSVTSSTNAFTFMPVIRDASKWNTLTGTSKDFITAEVTYTF